MLGISPIHHHHGPDCITLTTAATRTSEEVDQLLHLLSSPTVVVTDREPVPTANNNNNNNMNPSHLMMNDTNHSLHQNHQCTNTSTIKYQNQYQYQYHRRVMKESPHSWIAALAPSSPTSSLYQSQNQNQQQQQYRTTTTITTPTAAAAGGSASTRRRRRAMNRSYTSGTNNDVTSTHDHERLPYHHHHRYHSLPNLSILEQQSSCPPSAIKTRCCSNNTMYPDELPCRDCSLTFTSSLTSGTSKSKSHCYEKNQYDDELYENAECWNGKIIPTAGKESFRTNHDALLMRSTTTMTATVLSNKSDDIPKCIVMKTSNDNWDCISEVGDTTEEQQQQDALLKEEDEDGSNDDDHPLQHGNLHFQILVDTKNHASEEDNDEDSYQSYHSKLGRNNIYEFEHNSIIDSIVRDHMLDHDDQVSYKSEDNDNISHHHHQKQQQQQQQYDEQKKQQQIEPIDPISLERSLFFLSMCCNHHNNNNIHRKNQNNNENHNSTTMNENTTPGSHMNGTTSSSSWNHHHHHSYFNNTDSRRYKSISHNTTWGITTATLLEEDSSDVEVILSR